MKIFIKSSLVICLILLFNSCSSDDEKAGEEILVEEPITTEPSSTQVGIDVLGLDGIDYTDAVALASNVEEKININGIFENPYNHNGIEDLPVLITEGDDLLFGYFPYTLKSNNVTIDDILLFYFLIYPQIAIQGPNYSLLLNEIQNYSNYEDLKNKLVNSLNKNQAPILDNSFLNLIREFSTKINPESYSNRTVKSKSSDVVGEFKFNYERSGKIEWQKQTPLYSTMGLVIKDVAKNEIVFGPELLKTKSVQSAVTNWFLNTFVTELKPPTNSFTLTDNGEYEVLLTNGHSLNTELDLAINAENAKLFASKSLGLVLASGAKTLVSNNECKEALAQYFAQEVNFFVGLDRDSAAYPTSEEWVSHMRSAAGQAFSIVGDCSTGIGKKFFKFLGSAIVAFISTPTDIAEIVLLEIDYFNSEIAILETRYFENGLSFGEISANQTSESNIFSGNDGDTFQFTVSVQEKLVRYDVERTTFSDFIKEETFPQVGGIPFNVEVIEGNVTVNTSPLFTRFESSLMGNLTVPITLGCADSEIVVSPAFSFNEIQDYKINTKTKQVIEIYGSLFFGEVNINTNPSPTRVLEIHNPSCEPITISSISVPDGYTSSWSGGTIKGLETLSVTITFNPTQVKEYYGTITVNNSVDQENNSIGVSGVGTDNIIVTYVSHERIEGSPEGFYYANVTLDRAINGAVAENVFTRVAINGGGGGSFANYDPSKASSIEYFKDYPVLSRGNIISVPFYLSYSGGWAEIFVLALDPGPPRVAGGTFFRF